MSALDKPVDTSVKVTRRSNNGSRGWAGRDFYTEDLESSERRVLKQSVRWWEEYLHPKATLELNMLEALQAMFFGMSAAYIIYQLATHTVFWHVGALLALSLVGFGLYFSWLAFMVVPYGRLYLLTKGALLCLGIVLMFL